MQKVIKKYKIEVECSANQLAKIQAFIKQTLPKKTKRQLLLETYGDTITACVENGWNAVQIQAKYNTITTLQVYHIIADLGYKLTYTK